MDKLEKQWHLYVEKMYHTTEDKLHHSQKVECKRAFMGACGQLLLLIRDEAADLPEDAAVLELQGMLNEVSTFFLVENKRQN